MTIQKYCLACKNVIQSINVFVEIAGLDINIDKLHGQMDCMMMFRLVSELNMD